MSPEVDVSPTSPLMEVLTKPVSLAIIKVLVPKPLDLCDLVYRVLTRGLLDSTDLVYRPGEKTRVLIILNDLERMGVVEAHGAENPIYNLTPFYLNDVKAAILKHYFG